MSEFELEYEDSRINIKEAIRKIKDYNFYLKLFLCEETIANLGKFSKNTSDFRKGNSNVKDLWKDLLIDSISILKLNDTREKLNQAGFDNFQIDDKFKSIRLLNSYGIDELDKYFDDFVEFESVLYGSDSNYRDHVNHVIQVWLIGLVLLCKDENFKYLQFSDNFKLIDKSYSFDVKANDDFTPIESGKLVKCFLLYINNPP